MIIPIRCYTCGKVMGHLWEPYLAAVQELYNEESDNLSMENVVVGKGSKKTGEAHALDKLGVKRYCCRRMLLSHVDLCEKISTPSKR